MSWLAYLLLAALSIVAPLLVGRCIAAMGNPDDWSEA